MSCYDTLVDLERVFEARWENWRQRLSQDLQDSEIPVELGLPILIPGYRRLQREGHRQYGVLDSQQLSVEPDGEVRAFCLGYAVTITGLRGARPPIHLLLGPSGPIAIDGEEVEFAVRVRADYHGRQLQDRELFAAFPEPPLLVTASQYPEVGSVTMYELVPYLGTTLPRFALDYPSVDEGSRRMAEAQVPFLRWFFDQFGGATGKVCVDVGCGTGWLSGALAIAGVDSTIGVDLRRGSLAGFTSTFPEAENDLLAVGDMFEWPLGDRTVDVVFFRNNSAFCFGEVLGAEFQRMFMRVGASLRVGGVVYLSFISTGSGVADNGFTNLPFTRLREALCGTGLSLVKLMRIGSCSCAWICREGERPVGHDDESERRRWMAFQEVESATAPDDLCRQRFSRCLVDIAGEVVLRMWESGAQRVKIRGPSWLCWQLQLVLEWMFPEAQARISVAGAGPEPLRVDLNPVAKEDQDAGVFQPFVRQEQVSHSAAIEPYYLISADHDLLVSAALQTGRRLGIPKRMATRSKPTLRLLAYRFVQRFRNAVRCLPERGRRSRC